MFRPAEDNPYLIVSQDRDYDIKEDWSSSYASNSTRAVVRMEGSRQSRSKSKDRTNSRCNSDSRSPRKAGGRPTTGGADRGLSSKLRFSDFSHVGSNAELELELSENCDGLSQAESDSDMIHQRAALESNSEVSRSQVRTQQDLRPGIEGDGIELRAL